MSDLQLGIKITADGQAAIVSLDALQAAIRKAGVASRSAGQDNATHAGLLNTLKNNAASLIAVWAGFNTVKATIDGMTGALKALVAAGAGLDRMHGMLESASGSTQAAGANYQFVLETSQRLGLELSSTAEAFAKLTAASKGTTLQGEGTRAIFTSLSRAAAALGMSADSANGMLLAVGQMMSKGTVQAEELRGQLGERLPGAFNLAARAMGMTTAELGKQLDGGKVLATDLLPKLARVLDDTYSNARFNRINNEINRLSIVWTNFNTMVIDTDDMAKAIRFLTGLFEGFAKDVEGAFALGPGGQIAALEKRIAEERNIIADMEHAGPIGRLFTDDTEIERRRAELENMKKALADLKAQSAAAGQAAEAAATATVAASDQMAQATAKDLGALDKYQRDAVNSFKRHSDVAKMIVDTANQFKVDPAFALSIAAAESSFNQMAISSKGAQGIMQLMPGTAKRFGVEAGNASDNIKGGVKYLQVLLRDFNSLTKVAAAYNSGEGNVLKYGGVPPFKETQNYIQVVSGLYPVFQKLLGIEGEVFATGKDMAESQSNTFNRMKLHQEDAIKRAEEAAKLESDRIRTSMAALKAEEEQQNRVTAAQLAGTNSMEAKQTFLAQAARQSEAFHASEQSLVVAEIDNQKRLLEAKRAAYSAELAGASAGQYPQSEANQLAIKQAIRTVDNDLLQLEEARRQAEITGGAKANQYEQQSAQLRVQELLALQDLNAEYEKQKSILSQLQAAAASGASTEQLSALQNVLQSMPSPAVYSQDTINQAAKLNKGLAETQNQIKNLQSGEQKFAEEQLRLNAAFEDGVRQAQLFASHATEAFGKSGEGIGKMAVGIAQYFQQSYQAERDMGNAITKASDQFAKGQIDATERAKRELDARDKAATKSAQYQIGLFGDITSAAKGYFKEGTKGYQALENATKVFRMVEMALAIKSMAAQLMTNDTIAASDATRTGIEVAGSAARGQAKATEAVANEASGGDPYTAFPRAAMMAAMMAAIGFAVAGSTMGGSAPGGYAEQQKSQGTGTVLGDASAQSTSIEDSLAKIRDNSTNDLNYSAAMLTAMQNIETALTAASASIFTNVQADIYSAISRSGISFKKNQWGPFEYTQKSVTDAGILAVKQSLATILAKGFQGLEYADVTKKFNTLFGSSYKTTEYSQSLDKGTSSQITLIFRGMVDALKAGGDAFGLTADQVTARLKKFQVDIGKVSLQGLSGEAAQKAVSAIFGKVFDQMAVFLKVGIGKFQQIGEGAGTTFIRVAEGANRARGELAQLGVSMISLADVTNKRGQIDEELFKQSYLASGLASQGLEDFIARIHGTAQELKDSVLKFIEAENLLKTAGFDPAALQDNGKGQSALIDRVGGLDNFISLMKDFNDNFLTEAQRFAGASQTLGAQFAALGVTMPASKDSFYQLLTGIDKTTESGQKLFAALLQLNPAFARLQDQIQGIKDKYADILNPFGKYGSQIGGVSDDFSRLLTDASSRSASTLDAMTKYLNDQVSGYTNRQEDAKKMLDSLNASMASRQKQLTDATAVFDREMEKPPKKRNTKALNQAIKDIGEAQTAIAALQGFIDSSMTEIAGYKSAIDKLNADYAGASGAEKARLLIEKAGILGDAGKVMTKTLGDIFTAIAKSVSDAQNRLNAATTFQKTLQTQIASLQGPTATAALMTSRADAATKAVNDYWANMSAGATRNTDEELRLLGDAQQAVMDKYNAELAMVQQLQQAVGALDGAITSIRSQIATLQGPSAVASLAGSNRNAAFANLANYQAGVASGAAPDYTQEAALVQAAQSAVMERYNAEMALIQESVQVQAQALQDGLQLQIDGINSASQAQINAVNAASESQIESINSASQAQIDAINVASQSRIDTINSELELQQKSAQTAHDATVKSLQTQLDAAQKLTAAYQQIAEYAKSMKLGNLSTLSPEAKLAEAQKQYQDTLALARAGNADAAGKLTSLSDAYLESAKAYYGSGTQYANIFDGVQAAMSQVGGLNGGNPDSIQAHIDQLNTDFQANQDALRKSAQDQIKAVQDAAKAQTETAQQAARDQVKAAQDAAKAQTEAIQNASAAQIKSLQEDVAQQIKDLSDPNKNAAMKALKDATITDLEALQKVAEDAKAGAEKAAGDAAKAAEKYRNDTLIALQAIANKAEDTRQEAARQYAEAKASAEQQFNQAYQLANNQLITLGLIGGFSSAQNAALVAIAQSLIQGWTPPAATPVNAYAGGGYAQAGLALVGEKGPELVRFERPAQVMTAAQTREALSGDPKTFAALEAIKHEMKASVTVLSTAFPLLIAELQELRDEVAQMKRDQKLARNA